ncbi:MAG: hypothetical protein HYR49_10785 [Gammaproteobacteria bacterium]|nr:hypothetical protein [Gammaproteobacteria bacterium]
MNRQFTCFALFLALAISGTAMAGTKKFTKKFPLGDCVFVTEGQNPYFKLQIGRELHLDNAACVDAGNCDELEEVIITVLDETRVVTFEIDGVMTPVTTRVVEENESVDGQLAEVSRNFFAECQATRDVYYFGEEVDDYENGQIVSHEGEWEAGVEDATPGLFIPGGAFLLGSRYYQEFAPGIAKDRAEHVKAGLTMDVPAGTFEDCVKIKETTPLEEGEVDFKFYCPGVGIVIDEDLELTQIVE